MKKRIALITIVSFSFALSIVPAGRDESVVRQPVTSSEIMHQEPKVDPHTAFPPVVLQTSPVAGQQNVDPGLTEISVTYNREMTDRSWSWSTAPNSEFPEITGGPSYDTAQKTCTIQVRLKPNTTYATWLNSANFGNFRDTSGKAAVPYLLYFTTGDAVSEE